MDFKFSSIEELYRRVKPALRSKKKELNKLNYNYIKEEDIWNYLKDTKWKKSVGLSLSEMIDDILNTDNKLIDEAVKKNMEAMERTINLEEIEIIGR